MAQITTDMIIEACERDDGTGFCIACGQERMYCETHADAPRLKELNAELLAVVNEQAEDDGLWFVAQYASEAYLQQELRRLHAIIEAKATGATA